MVILYRVTLTPDKRTLLEAITRSGKTNAPKFIHARALLLCDEGLTVLANLGKFQILPRLSASHHAPSNTSSNVSWNKDSKPLWGASPAPTNASSLSAAISKHG